MSIASSINSAVKSAATYASNTISDHPKKTAAAAVTIIGAAGAAYYIHTNLDSIKESVTNAYDTAQAFITSFTGSTEASPIPDAKVAKPAPEGFFERWFGTSTDVPTTK